MMQMTLPPVSFSSGESGGEADFQEGCRPSGPKTGARVMRLIFLGAPGVGKGTQARLLKEAHGVEHLASGDLLRQAALEKNDLGQEIHRLMTAGTLVSDSVVETLLFKQIERLESDQSFSLDGFPRTVEQAESLKKKLGQKGQTPVNLVIDFEMSFEAIIRRLAGRRVCSKCGINYHLDNLPPKRSDQCDRCQAPLETRSDDRPETIRARLKVYKERTAPLLDYYRSEGILRQLPGDLSVDEQYQQLMALLEAEQLVPAG